MVGFVTAPAIAWGTGALEQLSGLGAQRAFVLIDPAVSAEEGPRRAVEELERAGAAVTSVADRPLSTAVPDIAALAARLRAVEPDWILAIGGGTTLDAAKAARLLYERPDLTLNDPLPVPLLSGPPRSRLVAAPTTSGSGAEASWAIDLRRADGAPLDLADRALVPDWAIVDPLFPRGLAAPRLVAGALQAAALAAEAYVSAWANPFSDALAVDVLRTVTRRLAHAVRWSDDPEARPALHYAATAAGLAASNAQRGLAHALARALAGPAGLDYATVIGIVLPVVLEFDRPAARERLELLAEALRLPEEATAVALPERLRRLAASVGAPVDLAAAGASLAAVRDQRDAIVAATLRAPAVLGNPRVPTAAEIRGLLDTLLGAAPAR